MSSPNKPVVSTEGYSIESHDSEVVTIRLLRTDVKNVVSFYGSFPWRSVESPRHQLLRSLLVSMLDKGTKSKSKYEISDILESRGAELSFSSSGTRFGFNGRCLKKDLSLMVDLMIDQLENPLFDADEYEKVVTQFRVGLLKSRLNTNSRVAALMSSIIYPEDHPNYSADPDVNLKLLEEISLNEVVALHTSLSFVPGITIGIAGDVEDNSFERLIGRWSDFYASSVSVSYPTPSLQQFTRKHIHLADRPNLSVEFACPVDVRRTDGDYLPLFLASYILGGNFSARLMAIVRDKYGLTYGIGSKLAGVTAEYTGTFSVNASFSTDSLERGIGATHEEIERFISDGIQPEELEEKKQTVRGLYLVGLSTTRGLARILHSHAVNGFSPTYLTEYPELIGRVEINDVNAVIERQFTDAPWAIAVAGTLPDSIG